MRYEQAVRTIVAFHTRQRPYGDDPLAAETVVIRFGGRRFVWHAMADDGGGSWFPTVTTMIEDANDYAAERLDMERFLSAISWWTGRGIEIETAAGAGRPDEMDPPVATARRYGLGTSLYEATYELVVDDDQALRRVLAYHRQGLNTGGAFFRFLAFWNALDIACDNYDGTLPAWIRASMPDHAHLRGGDEAPPEDWWTHLQNERRSAVAHAVRDGRGDELDPDDPDDRSKLWTDARLLQDLVGIRVRERWGERPVWQRRQRD